MHAKTKHKSHDAFEAELWGVQFLLAGVYKYLQHTSARTPASGAFEKMPHFLEKLPELPQLKRRLEYVLRERLEASSGTYVSLSGTKFC